MVRGVIVTLTLLALLGLPACASSPLAGTWRQTGVVDEGGVERSVPASEAVVLELRGGGKADVTFPADAGKATAFTWETEDDMLKLGGHPDWEVREVFELDYELEGDRLVTDWIDGPPRRVFERR